MKISNQIKELKSLESSEGFYSRDKISWWLIKYEEEYYKQLNFFESIPLDIDNPRNLTKYTKESQFLDLYEALNKVLSFHNNESYFKEQLEVYELVKNDDERLNTWIDYHKTDKKCKYEEFVSLFSDNRTVTGFNLTILYPLSLPVKVKLDESEFQYTLKFLELLERLDKTEIIGVIEIINPIENIRLNEFQTYNKQTIVVSVNDTLNSELHIRFIQGKIQLLKHIKVGQKVKVYADLINSEVESNRQDYLGWNIELITN
jgi:hypothetical protein